MRHTIAAAVALLLGAGAYAETHVQGNVTQTTVLEKGGNQYIVEQDYVVPAGRELTIKQGCVFLFKAFTGMRIEGKLVVEGTPEEPVVFTSQYDADHNPKSTQLANPFDWNGIIIAKSAGGTVMTNFVLRYSAYGLNAQNPNVIVRNGDFRQNGQLHFTLDGKTQYVQDGVPFSYGASATAETPAQSSDQSQASPTKAQAKSPKAKTGAVAKQKKVFRFTCLGVGVVGLAVGTPLLISTLRDRKRMTDLNNEITADRRTGTDASKPTAEWNDLNGKYNGKLAGSIALESLGVLGLAGFGLTFAF